MIKEVSERGRRPLQGAAGETPPETATDTSQGREATPEEGLKNEAPTRAYSNPLSLTSDPELAAMRRTRERLAHPPLRPVGDWRASRAGMVAAYDRAIARALTEPSPGRVRSSAQARGVGRTPGATVPGGTPPGSVSARQEATR